MDFLCLEKGSIVKVARTLPRFSVRNGLAVAAAIAAAVAAVACGGSDDADAQHAAMVEQGKQTFRYDTFGDEAQWTDTLRMHEVVSAAVDPTTALSVGLKVDADALPQAVVDGIRNGSISLTSPATTVALLKLNAVVGLKGTVATINGQDTLTALGITCALCHSTVDDSFAPGIGKRLDGWPNRDLNPGAIIALSPAVGASQKALLNAWGKGKFDPRSNVDGLSKPVVIPPAYGLAGINKITVTGDGNEIAYWNRYVAVVEMGGLGSFAEPRLNLSVVHGTTDLVTAKLPALQAYQLSLPAPAARSRRCCGIRSRRRSRWGSRRAPRSAPSSSSRSAPPSPSACCRRCRWQASRERCSRRRSCTRWRPGPDARYRRRCCCSRASR